MEYIETTDGEIFDKTECTPLFHSATSTEMGDNLGGWEIPDGTSRFVSDVQYIKVYVIHGIEFAEEDSMWAEKYLTECFWQMFDETQRAELESDRIAMRESFANWTDCLCKDGDICQDSYNDLGIVE